MKKLLLIGLMLCGVGAFAQQSQPKKDLLVGHVNPDLLKIGIRLPLQRNIDSGAPINKNSVARSGGKPTLQSANEVTIGTTEYDLQTNNSISNRFVNNGDGTMSAVWTFSPDANTGYPNRGTGYNYFNGTSWMPVPSVRIESERSGFTNIGVTASGQEACIAHGIQPTGPSKGMIYTSRPAKGTGAWTTNDALLGEEPTDTIDFWPKMAVGGVDGKSIHAIWRGGSVNNVIDGQAGPVFYSRSTNDGAGWDTLETIIPLINSNFYLGFSADNYSIDAKDSVVAIVLNDLGTDVVLLKSTDDGNTWTKILVDSFPIPLYNGATTSTDTNNDAIPDTLWSGSGDPNVLIDNNNMVHVFYTRMRTVGTGTVGLSYFPLTAELYYWNESMGAQSAVPIAVPPDLNGNGMVDYPALDTADCPNDFFPFGTYGPTRSIEMPSAGVDANNTIYVCYQAADENSDPNQVSADNNKLFKHPYIMKSYDNGATWTNYNAPYDALDATQSANGEDLEGVFASMAKRVDAQIHLIYQRDEAPGTSLEATTTCDYALNELNPVSNIIYVGIDTADVPAAIVGIHEFSSTPHGVILSSNFPNPATTSTQFDVTLNAAVNVQVDVTDILGQNLYSESKGKLSTGIHTVTLNTSYLSSGIYFYTVTAGTERVSGKMIVQQ